MKMQSDTTDRHILLCTLGHSWAVVPEVYGFLAPEQLPLYEHHPRKRDLGSMVEETGLRPPTEIWICTTQGQRTDQEIEQLLLWRACVPQSPILRIWQAQGTSELASREECARLRELLLRACLLSREYVGEGQVALSLAGGRKTMSADLQWAGHVFGCQALIHVVAQEALPEQLRQPTPALLAQPLPRDLCLAILPFIAGRSRRSELLDVDPDGAGPVRSARFPLPLPPDNAVIVWPREESNCLSDEI